MRTPGPEAAVASPQLSRGCASCGKEQGLHQQLTGSRSAVGQVPGIVQQVLGSPGQPLDAPARAFFEPRFGHDFSKVRVHADGRAAEVGAGRRCAGLHGRSARGVRDGTIRRRDGGKAEAPGPRAGPHHPAVVWPGCRGHGQADLQRAPVGEASSALPVMPRIGDFPRLPRYIDNLFESATFLH